VALIDLFAQHLAQIAFFRAKNILPDRFVAEESQRVRNELPGGSQLPANGGNENKRMRGHAAVMLRSVPEAARTLSPPS
jgi:hypothetical protein